MSLSRIVTWVVATPARPTAMGIETSGVSVVSAFSLASWSAGPVTLVLNRLVEIPDQRLNRIASTRRERLCVAGFQFGVAKLVEVPVREPGGLADAVMRHQPEAAVKGGGRRPVFLEQVAECPVAHALQQASAALELGTPDARTREMKSGTHAAPAVDGPPTFNSGSTPFSVRAVRSYRSK
jgi:hypothetical protein